MDWAFHIAYKVERVPGLPKHFICDGAKWMPIFYDHHIWNNFMMPGY